MALSENLRDRWDRISPRERRLLVLLFVAVPVVLVLFLGMQISDGLTAIEARNARTRKALAVVEDLRARGAPSAVKDDPAAALPTTPVKLDIYLNNAAEKIGLTIPSFDKEPEVVRDGFVISTVGIELRLTPTQLTEFLAAVESNVAVAVTSLSARKSREPDKVDLKLDVAAYSVAPAAGASGSADGSAGSGGS